MRQPAPVLLSDHVADAAALSLRQFLAEYAQTTFLVVKLDDTSGQLEAGLAASSRRAPAGAPLDVLSFETNQVDLAEVRKMAAQLRDCRGGVERDAEQLRRRLARDRYYAIALQKRDHEHSAFSTRVSIGRARNADVVLRHVTVSKFHAWFERTDGAKLLVADGGTTNGTRLNGTTLPPRAPLEIEPGDIVCFGEVEALLCSAETVWETLRTHIAAPER